jgi:hypothetical protein
MKKHALDDYVEVPNKEAIFQGSDFAITEAPILSLINTFEFYNIKPKKQHNRRKQGAFFYYKIKDEYQ